MSKVTLLCGHPMCGESLELTVTEDKQVEWLSGHAAPYMVAKVEIA